MSVVPGGFAELLFLAIIECMSHLKALLTACVLGESIMCILEHKWYIRLHRFIPNMPPLLLLPPNNTEIHADILVIASIYFKAFR